MPFWAAAEFTSTWFTSPAAPFAEHRDELGTEPLPQLGLQHAGEIRAERFPVAERRHVHGEDRQGRHRLVRLGVAEQDDGQVLIDRVRPGRRCSGSSCRG